MIVKFKRILNYKSNHSVDEEDSEIKSINDDKVVDDECSLEEESNMMDNESEDEEISVGAFKLSDIFLSEKKGDQRAEQSSKKTLTSLGKGG